MKKLGKLLAIVVLFVVALAPLTVQQHASAESFLTDTFTGSTLTGSWLSGGNPNSACLTASIDMNASIPACDSETALDSDGNGALRLTSNAGSQAGFVINQTPITTTQGLQISFDTYQYNGTGADGIAFFLIDGAANPTQPGAFGGSLGYSNNNTGTPGIVGGYVGVGFDVFGNFSSSDYGTGGPGASANSITVRGSEATGYKYVTRKSASFSLANNGATARVNAKRHVVISISTNNIMTVYVDYENGQGPIKELSNIDLNTINGAGSLPSSLKFGFSASTGGSNDIHEITGLSVTTLSPSVTAKATQVGTVIQGESGQFTIATKNDPGAEATSGTITVTDTFPAGLKPTSASGTGWTCSVSGQTVTCSRPGDGANALAPGASAPNITVNVAAGNNVSTSINNVAYVSTPDNDALNDSGTTSTFTITPGDRDGADTATENAAPNNGDANDDGIADTNEANVTSFMNGLTNSYATLATSGDCDQNNDPYIASTTANAKADGAYSYPAGMMNFSVTCTAPGDTTTVTQYYFGNYDASKFVARKYQPSTQTYTTIPGATITNVTIGGVKALKITYDITDGGALDADGLANGTIVDPAGPAILADASTTTTPTQTTGSTLANTGADILAINLIAGTIVVAAIVVRRSKNTRHTTL